MPIRIERPFRPQRWYDVAVLAILAAGGLWFCIAVIGGLIDSVPATLFGLGAGVVQALILAAVAAVALPRVWTNADLVVAVCWGGFAATGVAGLMNSVGPVAVTAPFVEEALKLVGVFLILTTATAVTTPARGFAIGFLTGAGFEVIENVEYVLLPDEPAAAPVTEAWSTIVDRTLLGFGLHAFLVAISGAALAYALTVRNSRGRWVAVGGFVTAAGLHLLWNSAGAFGGGLIIMIPIYLLVITLFLLVRHRVVGSGAVR